ncbi:MAG: hypothetical protein AB7U59_13670 [Desulfovibrionaceae bacterium]
MSSGGGKGKGSQSYTTGYRYRADIVQALCSRMSALVAIMVGKKVAWKGSMAGGTISINNYGLFGGDNSEGGLAGNLVVRDGNCNQQPSEYLAARVSTLQPAYRGIVTVEAQDFYFTGPNPYPKDWYYRLQNYSTPWQPGLIAPKIDGEVTGCNGVHVIWDALTSECYLDDELECGAHIDPSQIDEASFIAAAQIAYNEGLGISPIWDGSISTNDFALDIVNNYLNGTIYDDPITGLKTIKLFRGDYDVNDLETLDETKISKLVSHTRKQWGDLFSQVVLSFTQVNDYDVGDGGDCETNRTCIRYNLQCHAIQGKTVAKDVSRPYITHPMVASRATDLVLAQYSTPWLVIEIMGGRALAGYAPGDVFLFSWAALGTTRVVMRVLKVKRAADNAVTLTCSEDIYGLDFAMFSGVGSTGWTSPIAAPADATSRRLVELPYHLIVNQVISESDLADRDETSGLIAALIGQPSGTSLNYDLYEYVASTGDFADRGARVFTPTGELLADTTQTDTSITVVSITEPRRIEPGENYLAIIDSEWVWATAGMVGIAGKSATLTIARGVLDTTPAAHAAGARVWFIGWTDYGLDETVYLQGLTARIRACPRTARGVLALASASENSLEADARAIRPYPPANVRINGAYYPAALADNTAITVTWDNRNRLNQTGGLFAQSAGNILPESGTTLSIYLYDADTGTLIRSVTGLTTEPRSWTYPLDTELADREERVGEAMRVEVEAVRDAWASWQRFVVPVPARAVSVGCLATSDGDIIATTAGDKLAYED